MEFTDSVGYRSEEDNSGEALRSRVLCARHSRLEKTKCKRTSCVGELHLPQILQVQVTPGDKI